MKLRKSFLIALTVIVVLTTGLLSAQDVEPQYGGTLQTATDAEWTGLDPHVASTVSSFVIIANVAETLTTMDDNMELTPLLAESWEQSEDGLTWIFYLREGVLFSNGEEMTSEHVIFSMNRILDPDTGSGRVSSVGGADAVWEAIDANTISVTTSEPNAILPISLAGRSQAVIHPDSVDDDGKIVVPVGTGPFIIEDLEGTISLNLVKNDNYWQEGLPYLDAVEITVIQEAASREAALLGGEVDFVRDLARQSIATLQDNDDVVILVSPALAYQYIGINVTREPLNDVRVRQAIAYAIDRQQICDAGDFSICTPIQGPIDKGSPWYFDLCPV